ncbi:MAG: hypothetical protein GF390_03150, partial [Candidatus Pacebacteria bacterium]|nr:hypothetical protein [Candidatus Paceibacterota bacterium]
MKLKLKNNHQQRFALSLVIAGVIVTLLIWHLATGFFAYQRAKLAVYQAKLQDAKKQQQELAQQAQTLLEPTAAPFPTSDQPATVWVSQVPQPLPSPSTVPKSSGVKVTLRGFVYEDKNCNYVFDGDDAPLVDAEVSIFQLEGEKLYLPATQEVDDKGFYVYTTTIGLNDQLILQPGPHQDGYSILTMSG